MAFIVNKTTALYIDGAALDIQSDVPAGIWTIASDKFHGIYLEKYNYDTGHGKTYGKSQKIADHIFDAYRRADKNTGVLLSGGKGLGKSLTARLVIEKAVNEKIPVIIINSYLQGLVQFLKNISGCVILFDEFEKVFSGNVNEESPDTSLTKQEELLSLFDGTSAGKHNLFLLTANKTSAIDDNMLSRPGRIKYHYRYESENEDTIRSYCADNLRKPNLENDIVEALVVNRYISLDIIKALVDEVNNFDVTVDGAMEYLNIETTQIFIGGKITYFAFGKEFTDYCHFGSYYFGKSTVSCQLDIENNGKCYTFEVTVPMKGKKIPLFGEIDVSDVAQIYNFANGEDKKNLDLHVTKVELYEDGTLSNVGCPA